MRVSLRTDPTAEYKTPEQGAATSVFVATSPLLDGIGGRYFEDCNQAVPTEASPSASASPTMPSTPALPDGSGSSPHRPSADTISHSLPVTR
jgi:hypothetical protein